MAKRRSRKSSGMKKKMNELVEALSVKGGIAGLLATVLAAWVIYSWVDMGCETDKCRFPLSSMEVKEETDMMHVKFGIAIAVILSVLIFAIN